MAETTPPPSSSGNILTRKIGPAPAWVWAAGAGVVVFLWIRHRSGSAAASAASSGDAGSTGTDPGAVGSAGAGAYDGGGDGYQGSLGTQGEDFSAVYQELAKQNATLAAILKRLPVSHRPPVKAPARRHEARPRPLRLPALARPRPPVVSPMPIVRR